MRACLSPLLVVSTWIVASCDRAPQRAPSDVPRTELPRLVREDRSDAPLTGLGAEEIARFVLGDARFSEPFTEVQGLGPHYVHRSCASCHEHDARGPGVVRRIVSPAPLPFGDVVRPRLAAGARSPILEPEGARTIVRLGPAVFGRGWIEAIDDATLRALAAAQRERAGSVRGRVAELPDDEQGPGSSPFGEARPRLGRFGHKAKRATLEEFIADALLSDMGLTSPWRPEEPPNPDGLRDDARPGIDVTAETVARLADYVRMLAIPARASDDPRGLSIFREVGCADCHVPSLRTRGDHPIEALRAREAALYTDLLLHDMGEALDDGIVEGAASGREWRTAPLVGLRFLRGFLHDGRASSVLEAIAAHRSAGSEANDSVARFEALGPTERALLIGFVEGL